MDLWQNDNTAKLALIRAAEALQGSPSDEVLFLRELGLVGEPETEDRCIYARYFQRAVLQGLPSSVRNRRTLHSARWRLTEGIAVQ